MNLTAFITYDSSKDTGKKLSKSSIVHRQFNRNDTSASQHSSPEPPVPQPPRKVHSHLILSHNFQCMLPNHHMCYNLPFKSRNRRSMCRNRTCTTTQYRFAASQEAQHMPLRQVIPTTMATAISSLQNRLLPQPSNGIFELHLLQNCPQAVRVCFGCLQRLKPDNCVLARPMT